MIAFKSSLLILFPVHNLLFTVLSGNSVLVFTRRVLAHQPAQWPPFNETAASCFCHENGTKIFTRKAENGSTAAGLLRGYNRDL